MIDNENANKVFKANFPNGLTPFNEEAIRADERAKCRAELREKVEELIDTMPDYEFADRIYRWANGTEAFGGE